MRPVFAHLIVAIIFMALGPWDNAYSAIPVTPFSGNQGVTTLAPIVKKVSGAVVSVSTRSSGPGKPETIFDDPVLRGLFGLPEMPSERERKISGSGVVIDSSNGYIVTNHHVVENAEEITVTFLDGRQVTGRLVGSDLDTDIAVIKVAPVNLSAIPFGDSEHLEVGDFVLAIGNAYGFGQTVTSGIVSALHRNQMGLEGYEEFIQTDAAINPGNSGGALTNLRGELIGINAAVVRAYGAGVGIGFAIPSHMVRAIAGQLIKYGTVDRGELGISTSDLSAELARKHGLPPDYSGVIVTRFETGSAAERAGLKIGDLVTAINGAPVRETTDLRNRVGMLRVGDFVELTVQRRDKSLTIKVLLTASDY